MQNVVGVKRRMSKILCIQDEKEKQKTRRLYEEVFAEDSKQFVDYYYTEKVKDNVIYGIFSDVEQKKCDTGSMEQETAIAMLHLNPYEIIIRTSEGKSTEQLHYIVAVATKEEYRHKGFMDKLLKHSLQDMQEAEEPFCYLMPANPKIYEPYQFSYVYDRMDYQKKEEVFAGEIQIKEVHSEEDVLALLSLSQKILAEKYDCYASRNLVYYQRLQRELQAQNGNSYLLYQKGEQIGYYFYAGEEDVIIEAEVLPKYSLEDFFTMKKRPIIMARIVDLQKMGAYLFFPEERTAELTLVIEDRILPQNNGTYLWRINEKKSQFIPQSRQPAGKDTANVPKKVSEEIPQTTIDRLTAFCFGYATVEECFENIAEEQKEILEKVQTLRKVFLNEIV